MRREPRIAVIGGGPAGLRAAEVAAAGGARVTLFDAQPSVGRKFLVAGRGGLNLTHNEPLDAFSRHYPDPERWRSLLAAFDPGALCAWAAGLGVETFVASTGRVYPRELKAAPLLRRWVARLRETGVHFAMRHRWEGLALRGSAIELAFQMQDTQPKFSADAVILALGGGSWPQTGSDGAWTETLARLGVEVASLVPANCGWECAWPAAVLSLAEGRPLKNISVSAGGKTVEGELLITRYGLEGGALYALGSELRAMEEPSIFIDFKPSLPLPKLVSKMASVRGSLVEEARSRWRLGDAAFALLSQAGHTSVEALASAAKNYPVRLSRPRPLAEAISSAGGVCWGELDEGLMLKKLPGVFVAGEMVDWEAPTGGYLLQGCFATATRAAHAALERLAHPAYSPAP